MDWAPTTGSLRSSVMANIGSESKGTMPSGSTSGMSYALSTRCLGSRAAPCPSRARSASRPSTRSSSRSATIQSAAGAHQPRPQVDKRGHILVDGKQKTSIDRSLRRRRHSPRRGHGDLRHGRGEKSRRGDKRAAGLARPE